MYAYLKILQEGIGAHWTAIRVGAESEEALRVKIDNYLADGWAEATEEEYETLIHQYDPKPEQEVAASEEASEPASEPAPEATPEAEAAPETEPAVEPES